MFLSELNDPVDRIKGIGSGTAGDLKNLGISDIKSLLKHYPVRWEDRLNITPIKSAVKTGYINSIITIIEHSYIGFGKKKTLKILVKDDTGYLTLMCFGRNFLENKLNIGDVFYLYGNNIQYKFSELQCSSFEFESYIEDTQPKLFNQLLPIYKLSGKLTHHNLRKFIKSTLNLYANMVTTELTESIIKKHNLMEKRTALLNMHFPVSEAALEKAQHTLIFEELFHLQMITGKKIISRDVQARRERDLSTKLQLRLINKLPFDLTPDQVTAVNDILKDLNSGKKNE